MSDEKKPICVKIEHQNIAPGWGCCVCRVYNGVQRTECKNCKHKRCDINPDNKAN